jgi:GntR family transcriptional regulator of arabinose operon
METPLYEKIYQSLLDQIQSGHLKKGERIPSEKELCDQFQVSRITSKKALEKLSLVGVVERIRGKGSFVSNAIHSKPSPIEELQLSAWDETSNLIGIIAPEFSDLFGMQILRTVEKKLAQHPYHLIVKLTYGSQEDEEQAIQALLRLGVKGLIICPVNGEHYNAELLHLVYRRFPVVLIDKYLKGIPACAVYTDNKRASQMLTEYLFEQGHTHIAFVSSDEENTTSIEGRLQGFTAALLDKGLFLNPSSQYTKLSQSIDPDQHESDFKALEAFVLGNPTITGFVVCEYMQAVFLNSVLKSLGESVPRDVEIVCFDSVPNPFGPPVFTHILQDETAIGERAVELLHQQINGEQVSLHTVIDFKLLKGEQVNVSSGKK